MNRIIETLNSLYRHRKPEAKMDAAQAVAAARAHIEALGGTLEDPVYVSVSPEGKDARLVWLIRDRCDQRGGNAQFRIDDATGEVLEYGVPGSTPV